MRCCVTPCGQTDVGSSQKTFLVFSRTSKRFVYCKYLKAITLLFYFILFYFIFTFQLEGEGGDSGKVM